MESQTQRSTDRRSFVRVPFVDEMRWSCQPESQDAGNIVNFSRGGFCLATEAPIPTAETMTLHFETKVDGVQSLDVRAQALWSDATLGGSYRVGFRVIHDGPHTLHTVSKLLYVALEQRVTLDSGLKSHLNPGDLLTNHSWIS